MINKEEELCMSYSVDLWNTFLSLDDSHSAGGNPNDVNDVRFHIQAIQNILLSRATLREYRKTEILES